MKTPKISLVIPVYNVENYLAKCLDSALNQTLKDIEIIAVDDGSTDGSSEILSRYVQQDNRLVVLKQENQGLSGARNTGIRNAKGEFLAFLDSDDTINSKMLEVMYLEAQKNNSDIVICKYRQVNEDGSTRYTSSVSKGLTKDEHFRGILSAKTSAMSCNKLFNKNLYLEHNIFYPIGLYHEDVATIFKLFFIANKISVVDEELYYWLYREGSISKSISSKHIDDVFEIFRITKQFLDDSGVFELYKREYARRCLHFSVGLITRLVGDYENGSESTNSLFMKIISKLEDGMYDSNDKLALLVDYDHTLYRKYDSIVNRLKKNIFDNNTLDKHKKNGDGELKQSQRLAAMQKRLELEQIKRAQTELELEQIKSSIGYKGLQKINRIVQTFLPPNSKRLEMVMGILHGKRKGNESNSEALTNQPSGKMPMLDVKAPITTSEKKAILKLRNKFKGKRCFIVGNGPSLNKCDLRLLKNEFTFGVNGIFYKTDEMGFRPTFYVVEDGHVVDDNLERINSFDCRYKLFPSLYRDKIVKNKRTCFFPADLGFYRGDHPSHCIPRFSIDCSEAVYAGQSVSYMNMQWAFYLGFSEVYLIGMDFSYAVPKSTEIRGNTYISQEDDQNHFHPDYFGKGKKWHDPKVERVALNYEMAKKVFEENNRKIFNATVGGKLEVFPRIDFSSLF